MTKNSEEAPRGDAAWRAAKAEMAERNDKARARGGELRAASEAAKLERRRALDAREREDLPEQPRP
jgi:hypothetical protein